MSFEAIDNVNNIVVGIRTLKRFMNEKEKWMGKVIRDQSQWGHKKVNVIKSMCDLYICVSLLSIE